MDLGPLQLPEGRSAGDIEQSIAKPRVKVVRHATGSTRILNEWFASHRDHPYPPEEEKEILSVRTGLTPSQISYWFVNARRRRGYGPTRYHVASGPSSTIPSSMPGSCAFLGGNWDNMTPLDRWRHTPPDQEAAPLSAITQAAESSLYSVSAPNLSYHGPGTAGTSPQVNSSSLSFGSHDFSTSGQGSESSTHSHSSASVASIRSHNRPRRRRRRHRSPAKASSQETAKRIYQCTFCTDTFKTKYDWTRHEGTLHLVLEKWMCLLFGPRYCDPAETQPRCALCDAIDPSDSHLQLHGYRECASKPLGHRVFYRKDHLRQHLRVSHGINDILPSMASWKSIISRVKSRCGFCGETFTLWSARNDHLADHFRSGALMKNWKGCRGLEPAVALLVENAMPPYLIGIESHDLEPFSASRASLKAASSTGAANNQAPRTRFETLTARLGDYVRTAKESGVVVTDERLQREARLILFGDDDLWNQTPADNVEWLELFKKGYGLFPAPYAPAEIGPTNATSFESQACGLGPLHGMDFSPFTLEKMQQATLSDSSFGPPEICDTMLYNELINQQEAADLVIPWSWQTPECLAEFSQMSQTTQTTTADTTDHLDFDMISSSEFGFEMGQATDPS